MPEPTPKIVIEQDGPYHVYGSIPLVFKRQIVTKHGEPLTWQKGEQIPAGETYKLCRCGQSKERPFCDCTHVEIGFDGTETADIMPSEERRVLVGGTEFVVMQDPYICMESGFCGTRHDNLNRMLPATSETEMRSLVIAMIERCPSGSYTYALEQDGPDVEPDLPVQIAVITEETSDGPVGGPYWVTGGILIERADGQPFETRNRVMLCGCGLSKIKPLCDGSHRHEHFPPVPGFEAVAGIEKVDA